MRLIDADAILKADENSDKALVLGSGKSLEIAYALLKKKVADAPTVDAVPAENCKAYGDYLSSVEDVAEAKRLLAKQAARCVERAMLDNDMFLVDGGTVSWKLLLYGGEGDNG